jgi:hypothetical protein
VTATPTLGEVPVTGESSELERLLDESVGRRVSLLSLLQAVGTRRRSASTVRAIEEALAKRNLEAWPPITVAPIDGELELRSSSHDASRATTTAPPTDIGVPPGLESGPDIRAALPPEADLHAYPRRLGLYVGNVLVSGRETESVLMTESPRNVMTRLVMRSDQPVLVFRDKASRVLEGLVTWESIVRHQLSHGFDEPERLSDLISKVRVVREDEELLPLVPHIMLEGHVAVMDRARVVVGLLSVADVAQHFIERTRPYLMVGDIEDILRLIVAARLLDQWEEIADLEAEAYGDNRRPTSPEDLSFSTYLRALQSPSLFDRLGWRVDRKIFVRELDIVRDIRNDIMHFSPDPSADAEPQLQRFLELLRVVEPQLVASVAPVADLSSADSLSS